MQYFEKLIAEEKEQRMSPTCAGCGKEKDHGENACIVCWACFKHPVHPYKTWSGTFNEWKLTMHPENSLLSIVGKGYQNGADEWERRAKRGEIMRII